MKHLIPAVCGTIGLIGCLSPLIISIPLRIELWAQKQEQIEQKTQIINNAELDRVTIEQRDKVAQYASRKKQAVPNRTLKMAAYVFDPDNPPPTISTKGYLSSDRIQIYDATNRCIGEVYQRKFRFIADYPDVCDNPPLLSRSQ